MDYRREIDGLRALAVLPVILFHAGFQTFSGGFIGVDVFFVISGYLITGIILAELEQGKFSIVNFYERRGRRIWPALFSVMFVCLPLALLWLSPDDLTDFSKSLTAVSIFASNILFWKESGYFAATAELKPLLHTWSLAVEEQYYVLFPLFLMTMWRFAKRWILVLLALAFIISLSAAQWGSITKPTATFYLLPTRGWELLTGVFCTFFISNKWVLFKRSLREIGAISGISLICYSVFAFNEEIPFPSTYALIPTLGSALIILCADSETAVGKFLGSRVLVGIGLISYSAYLWHQPLIAFTKNRSILELDSVVRGTLVVLSIALAYFSWKYIEKPFRDKKKFSKKFIFTLGGFLSIFFIIIGTIGYLNKGFIFRFDKKIQEKAFQNQFASHDLRKTCDTDYDEKNQNIQFCILGDTNPQNHPAVAVFGDSHSNALNPVFDLLGKMKNKSYVHIGLGGCPPLIGVDVARGNYDLGVCKNLAEREYNFVQKNNIKKVILISRWSLYTDGNYNGVMGGYFLVSNNSSHSKTISRKVLEEGLRKTIQAYKSLGVEVYILLQIPQQEINSKTLYIKLIQFNSNKDENISSILNKASINFDRHLSLQEYNRRIINNIAKNEGAIVLNPDPFFCDAHSCSIGNAQISFYKDADHVNTAGAVKLVPLFTELFE
ncbi:MAG: acyltransferase [Betaproteobacteria bacterium]|nr:acyltransferase [Betaproteobacteria bacterium]